MINEQIRDREVRLIGENGEQLGIMSSRDAYKHAQEAGLDLVKIAPTAKPPVCKIIDYGKYRYEMARKEKEAKKKQRTIDVKTKKPLFASCAVSSMSEKSRRVLLSSLSSRARRWITRLAARYVTMYCIPID